MALYVYTFLYNWCSTVNALNFSETRKRLKAVMDQVVRDHTPVVVSRKNGGSVVMVSLADWNATEETTHLLSRRANADRLAAAIAVLDAGRGEEKTLAEP
jgi:antitoxin YefM